MDLWRWQDQRLVGLHGRLREEHGELLGRELLLVEAWLAGVVEIAGDREWVAKGGGELERRARGSGADAVERVRGFAVRFYLDRASPGECDAGRREEMAELCPVLFARVIAEIARREGRRGPRLGF